MSTKFYKLQIAGINRLTNESVELTFDMTPEARPKFDFKAGQHLTLRYFFDGEELRRSYSICSIPSENRWSVAIKRDPYGRFSTFANDNLNVGDEIEVMPPLGKFTINHIGKKNLVFFAAGSGITPIISQIKEVLFHYPDINVNLFYGNRGPKSIMFKDEIEGLKNKFMDRLSLFNLFSKDKFGPEILQGRLDNEKIKLLVEKGLINTDFTDAYMICGPNNMIFKVKEALEEVGVPQDKIFFELFNTDGIIKEANPAIQLDEKDKSKESTISIKMDGDIYEFPLEYGGQSMLDAGLAHGADLPYSCKAGVCSTCKAKVTEGEVVMDVNYALEPSEVEQGYVLMCQCHPRTDFVAVDYDQK